MAETMEAGADLDALIAERVFGHAVTWERTALLARAPRYVPEGQRGTAPLPMYSHDMGAAWLVAAEVQRRNPGWRFSLLGGDVSYGYVGGVPQRGIDRTRLEAFGWHAEFHGHIDPSENYGQRHGDEYADTPALAICRAALAAVSTPTEPTRA